MGEGFVPKFGEESVERIECDGTEWIGGKGKEGDIETHGMVGSKIRLERGSNGEVKVGNDWEVDGKQM